MTPLALAMANLDHHEMVRFFIALAVLLGTARLLGELARKFHQPSVLGEMFAGVLLGQTVLHRIAPDLFTALFPADGPLAVSLDAFSSLSIALFLLVAGLEVDLSSMWRKGRLALSVGLWGMILPFALGIGAAYAVPSLFGVEPSLTFALFLATALSISALPVIARTLMDLGLYRSDVGMIVVAAAVFNDLVGWLIFAVVLGLLGTSQNIAPTQTLWMIVLFVALMLTVGRFALHKTLPWLQAHASWPGGVISFALTCALLCAAFTEYIGVHAVFGAFIFGVALGDSAHLREQTRFTLDRFISFFFAPLFFATIGLHVDFVAHFDLGLTLIVFLVATLGKVVGCGLGAKLGGLTTRQSLVIGFGMNARGAMEIILGLLALQTGLIKEEMFVALVVMAVGTSMLSGPLMQRFADHSDEPSAPERPEEKSSSEITPSL